MPVKPEARSADARRTIACSTRALVGRSEGVMREFKVTALWDPEASVWVAESDDVPGLVTEADTVEQLVAKLRVMVPELLEVNGVPDEAF